MRKTWIGPLCMVAAALCCVLLGEWASHRILDEGSPVSFQTYQTQTQAGISASGGGAHGLLGDLYRFL